MIAPGSTAAGAPARAASTAAAATPGPATAGEAGGAPGDPLLALVGAGAAPFSQAIAALRGGPGGATRAAAEAIGSDTDRTPAGPQATDARARQAGAAAPSDPTLAVLAAVLQWLQQQGGAAAANTPAVVAVASGGAAERAGVSGRMTAGTPESAAAAGATGAADPTGASSAPGGAGVRGDAAALAALTPVVAGGTAGDAMADPQDRNTAAQQGAPRAPVPTTVDGSLAGALAAALAVPVAQSGHDGPSRNAAAAAAAAAATAGAAAGADLAAAVRNLNSSGAAPVPATERSLQLAVHDPQWPRAVAAQLLMLGEQKIQAATLRLSPEHLGPVEVRIDLKDAHVNVAFTAAHVETRAALEQSIPQLREVFAGSGLTLGQATVQSHARQGSQNQGSPARAEPAAVDSPSIREPAARALGLVDEYA